jgi:hypothetical protein
MILILLELLFLPSSTVTLPRPTLAATSPLAYELLSWAFEDHKDDWVESMLDNGTAVSLRAGEQVTVAGVNLRARPVSATVIVNRRLLLVPRSALQGVNP